MENLDGSKGMKMQEFKIFQDEFIFCSRCRIENFEKLNFFLKQNKEIIKKVKFETDQSFAALYMVKKILGSDILFEGLDEKQIRFFKYVDTALPPKNRFISKDNFNPLSSLPSLASFKETNANQDKFWLKNLILAERILLLDAINTTFIWFFCSGFTFSLICYRQLVKYSLEIESYILVYLGFVRFICPIMSAFVMTAKSCTALASSTKAMEINGESKVLSLMNLPLSYTYLHPIFTACIIATPILNLIAIFSSTLGSFVCYIFMNASLELLFSIYEGIFFWGDILESCAKSIAFGAWIGIVTCSSAQYPGKSFRAIIYGVDSCVTYSVIGFIFIQLIIEFFSKS